MKVRRIRTKGCGRCHLEPDTLYRVTIDDSGTWHFVCAQCLPSLKSGNPRYVYGGTWKSEKRH